MNDKNQVKCPHCAEMIDVTNVMTHQIEENFKAKYRKELLSINKKRADIDATAFTLLKVVGKGSFGKVMQVKKNDTGKIYAMKVRWEETEAGGFGFH